MMVQCKEKCSKLVIVTLNCHGFNHIETIKLTTDYNEDIVALQETWGYDIPNIKGYNKFHVSRMNSNEVNKGRAYGGIGVYVRESIAVLCTSKSQNHISIMINEQLTINNVYFLAQDKR